MLLRPTSECTEVLLQIGSGPDVEPVERAQTHTGTSVSPTGGQQRRSACEPKVDNCTASARLQSTAPANQGWLLQWQSYATFQRKPAAGLLECAGLAWGVPWEQAPCSYSIEGNKGIQVLSHTYNVLMKSDLAASKAGNLWNC